MEKLLSICIPTYNRKNELIKLLDFLLSENIHTYNSIELIVSDNGSKYNAYDILSYYQKKIKNMKINIFPSNVGVIKNFRTVVSMSNSKYVWIIGDDDILYKGIINKVARCLAENKNISHIFINHCTSRNNKIISSKVYNGKTGYFNNGIEMFENICMNSYTSFGILMFMSANIYKRDYVLECNGIIDQLNEKDNLALPLGYSLYCSKGPGYVIGEVYINDICDNISWSDSAFKVQYRDMIAIVNKISIHMGIEKRIDKLLLKKFQFKYSEFQCIRFRKRINSDDYNYVMKWMLKSHKFFLIQDFFKYILSLFFNLSKRISNIRN